jgi:hypothetical protein
MRALATSKFVVFLTRRAGGADALLARVVAGAVTPVGRRAVALAEIEAFLGQMSAAGVEVVESAVAAPLAIAAPATAAVAHATPAAAQKPVESTWLNLSEIILATQKTRGPNVR